MKITKIAFTGTFPITSSGRFEKIYLEAELTDEDNIKNSLYSLKRQVSDFFYESNKAAEKQAQPESTPIAKVADLIQQIKTCTELKVLESYQFIVKNDPDMQTAYDNKLKELQP